MFDSKIRTLPKGHEFFAKVHYCNMGSALYKVGIRDRHLLVCTMLSEESDNPLVRIHFANGTYETSSDVEYSESLLTYEGDLDGSGFICEGARDRAMGMLKGQQS